MKITVIVETDSGRCTYVKAMETGPDAPEDTVAQAVVDLGTRLMWKVAGDFGNGSYEALTG